MPIINHLKRVKNYILIESLNYFKVITDRIFIITTLRRLNSITNL